MLKFLLFLLSIIYSFILKLRNFFYDNNVISGTFFRDVFIISVGNLAVGGTGKTPHTEYLVSLLKNDYKIAVLSRGYKRKTKGFLYVEQSSRYKEVGDEPLQIALKFPDIIVAVCENRVAGIQKLKKEKNVDIVILDDAFQHRKVIPQISILLTTYNKPFYKDHFLPYGTLRDNKSEYTRANFIIITKSPDDLKPIQKTIIKQDIKIKPYQELFFTKIKYLDLVNVYNKNIIKSQTNDTLDIILVTGIANTDSIKKHIKENISKNITHLKFSDHKNFNKKDINKIIETYQNTDSEKKIIITTEKDYIRLKEFDISNQIENNLYYLPIETEILFNESDNFKNFIFKSINK